jgi:hypothetical protein
LLLGKGGQDSRNGQHKTGAKFEQHDYLLLDPPGERLVQRIHEMAQYTPDLFRIAAHQDRILDSIGT